MRLRILIGTIAAAAGAALAGAVAASPPAAATTTSGTYTITACSPSTSSGAWTSVNQATASLTTTNACGAVPAVGPDDAATNAISTTGALFGEDQIGSTTPVPTGSQAGWGLAVPAGIEITGISYYSSYETDGGGWLAGLQVDGVPQGTDCQTNLLHTRPCAFYNNQVPQVETGLTASSLFLGVQCAQVEGGVSCLPNSETSHAVEAALYSAQVTLERTGGPIVQNEGGPLWGSGVVSGVAPLSFDATDPAGIQDVRVLNQNGSPVLDELQSCTYTQVQACPELPAGQVEINTAGLPDGAQSVELVLTNAAGDTTVARGPTFVVDNNGPPAPAQLTASAASTTSDVIDLAWANPTSPPQPIAAAFEQLCQATCADPVQVSAGGAAQVTAPAAGTYTVRLWLTDIAGQGSATNAATATVTVPETRTQTVTTTSTVTVPASTPKTAPCKGCPPKRSSRCNGKRCPAFAIRAVTWSNGWLTLKLRGFPKNDRLRVTLYFKHAHPRTVTVRVSRGVVKLETGRPTRTVLVAIRGKRTVGAEIVISDVR
jgi:hypothetical protein